MASEFDKVEILLVEDNPTDAELCVRALRKHHLANELVWVKDGAEALDFIFHEGAYASRGPTETLKVVLLDLRMPKIDGMEVLRRVKSDDRTRLLPIVILTSSKEDRDVVESYNLGVNSFISKPVDFDSFAEIVTQLGLVLAGGQPATERELMMAGRDADVIRLLILEDVPEDAELEERALRNAGISFVSRRVATHAEFVAALDSFHADLVITDYNLLDIDGLTAVGLIRLRDTDVPVVLVTGVLEDEAAVAVVKAGANDYVRKDRLTRLPIAVASALAAAANQRALRQSRHEIEDLYNNAPIGYHSVDRDLTIVSINDTELTWLGYQRDEVVGKLCILDLLTPDSATKAVQQSFPQLIETGAFHDVELDLIRKDGTILPVLLNSTAVTDPDGNFIRSRTTVYDNTRLKAAEEQQRKLQTELDQSRRLEAIGQLSAGIAHDFNNALQGIMSNLELVDDDIEVPLTTREYVASAVRLAEQAGELVRNLLSFARKQILLPHEVDLDDFLNKFQRLATRTLDPRVRIDVVTDPGLAPVWVDARHLQAALLNLAINARDAMPSGGNLRIEAFGNRDAAASGQVGAGTDAEGVVDKRSGRLDRCNVIRVSDTGTGIAPKDLARVCEPFFSTKGVKGTGLGLSMVHGFAKQSGGDLRIFSELGKGTSVEVWLPAVSSQAVPHRALAKS